MIFKLQAIRNSVLYKVSDFKSQKVKAIEGKFKFLFLFYGFKKSNLVWDIIF